MMPPGTMADSWPMLTLGEPCLGLRLHSSRGLLPAKVRWISLVWAVTGNILMSEECAELVPPLTSHRGRAGPRSMRAGNLTLPIASSSTVLGEQVHCWSCMLASLKDVSMGELALPLSPYGGMDKKRPLPSCLTTCNRQETWP